MFTGTHTPIRQRLRDAKGSAKYGNNSPWPATKNAALPADEQSKLEWLYAHSLARKTWNTYSTAEKILKRFCAEKDIPLTLPLAEDTVIRFIVWLACDKKLTAATISVYLSGVRQLHVHNKVQYPELRSDFIKSLLQGKRNSETTSTACQKQRKPITAPDLGHIKAHLTSQQRPLSEKRLIWSICTMLFFSACQANELLCTSTNQFDSIFCLTDKKIQLLVNNAGEKKICIELTSPKESRNTAPVFIDVFPTAQPDICPVIAWEKWQNCRQNSNPTGPHFRTDSGKPFTISALNEELKKIFGSNAGISSHSFRIGDFGDGRAPAANKVRLPADTGEKLGPEQLHK